MTRSHVPGPARRLVRPGRSVVRSRGRGPVRLAAAFGLVAVLVAGAGCTSDEKPPAPAKSAVPTPTGPDDLVAFQWDAATGVDLTSAQARAARAWTESAQAVVGVDGAGYPGFKEATKRELYAEAVKDQAPDGLAASRGTYGFRLEALTASASGFTATMCTDMYGVTDYRFPTYEPFTPGTLQVFDLTFERASGSKPTPPSSPATATVDGVVGPVPGVDVFSPWQAVSRKYRFASGGRIPASCRSWFAGRHPEVGDPFTGKIGKPSPTPPTPTSSSPGW